LTGAHGGIAASVRLETFLPRHITDEYLGWLNDPVVMRYTEARRMHHTRESAKAYVEAALASDRAQLWRILVESGHHVGNVRLSEIDRHHRRSEIALVIGDRDYWGKGVATAAIDLASREGFETFALHKIVAVLYASNDVSQRAFEKAGYRVEASLADHFLSEERYVDALFMVRFAE